PAPAATPSPQRLLGLIRAKFRSHRPPPLYETYTLVRKQNASNGYPDPVGSYTQPIWVRNTDRAALTRQVFRDEYEGPMSFDRPAFNEDRDPGPPTADVFEPAPVHPHPIDFVPTPEPSYTQPPVIGGIQVFVESDYTVTSVDVQGDLLHLVVEPKRDPDRNRIREIWADKNTYELRKLLATDKLFIEGGGRKADVYPVVFTITMGTVDGQIVVTDLHGVVGGGYHDDGQTVDFQFRNITFPKSLPDWYFNARTYAQHQGDAPT
ncbi:MAG: hypothetical protein JO101_03075, partial [Candidatus Eremiobacteraeota bacterium]|nr:hypothetical protein [Candidatus Eremiobacteraeota bacterium]